MESNQLSNIDSFRVFECLIWIESNTKIFEITENWIKGIGLLPHIEKSFGDMLKELNQTSFASMDVVLHHHHVSRVSVNGDDDEHRCEKNP